MLSQTPESDKQGILPLHPPLSLLVTQGPLLLLLKWYTPLLRPKLRPWLTVIAVQLTLVSFYTVLC